MEIAADRFQFNLDRRAPRGTRSCRPWGSAANRFGRHLGVNGRQTTDNGGSRGTTRDTVEGAFNQDRQANFLSTPNGIRTRAATLKGWCPRPLDDGGLFVPCRAWWSGCPDLNRGPLRPERSALTKLRYSPRQVSPQPDNPTRRRQPQPTAPSTGAWRSTTISLMRRFSRDWTFNVQSSKA